MLEGFESLEVLRVMVPHEIVRGVVHQGKEFSAFVDDGFALPPSEYGGYKTRNLNVLLETKPVRDADGVVGDKMRPIVLLVFGFKQFGYD
jgi:hypothetical protein